MQTIGSSCFLALTPQKSRKSWPRQSSVPGAVMDTGNSWKKGSAAHGAAAQRELPRLVRWQKCQTMWTELRAWILTLAIWSQLK